MNGGTSITSEEAGVVSRLCDDTDILGVCLFSCPPGAECELTSSSAEVISTLIRPREPRDRGFSERILLSALSRFRLYMGAPPVSKDSGVLFAPYCAPLRGGDCRRRDMGALVLSFNFRRLLRVP